MPTAAGRGIDVTAGWTRCKNLKDFVRHHRHVAGEGCRATLIHLCILPQYVSGLDTQAGKEVLVGQVDAQLFVLLAERVW